MLFSRWTVRRCSFRCPPAADPGQGLDSVDSSVRILGVAGCNCPFGRMRTVFFLFAIKNDRWLSMVCGCLVWSPLRSLPAKETVGVLLGGAKEEVLVGVYGDVG